MAQARHQVTLRPSDEAKQQQIALAKGQGEAFQRAVDNMTQKTAHGAERRVGDYLIGYAVEDAEGMYHLRDGKLEWAEPSDENAHVEIVVRNAVDGRFLPGLTVHATLVDSGGKEVGTHEQPFLWHPWIYHYGRNWRVPSDGVYTLRVRVEAPQYPRHDKINGKFYAEPAEVTFENVRIKTGQKRS
jgi:hypothetical protein